MLWIILLGHCTTLKKFRVMMSERYVVHAVWHVPMSLIAKRFAFGFMQLS